MRTFIRASDEDRRGLIAPYELILFHQCKRWGTLPVEGGYLNQPHWLMVCFEIIEREQWQWDDIQAREEKARQAMNEAIQKRLAQK